MTGLPLLQNKNPILQMSCQGGRPPHTLPPSAATFSRVAFPRVTFSKQLTTDLHPNLVGMINDDPSKYLAIIPFGGGKRFNEDNVMAGAQFTLFLKSLSEDQNKEDLSVVKATPATLPKNEFDPPWVYIMEGGSPSLCNFLLWQQTFASTPKIAFTIIPFDPTFCSWVIANITGDMVTGDPKIMHHALGVIKSTLWNDHGYRNITYACITVEGSPNPTECAFQSTLTFELHFAPNKSKSELAPMWILSGKLLTPNESLHQQYLRTIRGTTFFIGMHKLEIEKRWLDCVWCKIDTHPSHQCNFPETDGWFGPKPIRNDHLDFHPSTKREMGTRSNTTRGQRGSYNPMRGQRGSRSWGRGRK
jgi:hypothetical protein